MRQRYVDAPVEEGYVDEAPTRSRVVEHAAWSPAQIIGLAGGVVLIVIGAIALSRTGTDFSNIPATHAAVAGFGFTCLSAAVQLAAWTTAARRFGLSGLGQVGHGLCRRAAGRLGHCHRG